MAKRLPNCENLLNWIIWIVILSYSTDPSFVESQQVVCAINNNIIKNKKDKHVNNANIIHIFIDIPRINTLQS